MTVESSTSSSHVNPGDEWVGITEEDLALIRASRNILEPSADLIAKEFYDAAFDITEFSQVAERAGTTRERLEAFQKDYFLSLLDGRIDQAHIDRSLAIGARHAELGVQPRWMISLYGVYIRIIPDLLRSSLSGKKLEATWAAWNSLIQLDMAFLIEGYAKKTNGRYESVLDLLFLSSQFRSRVDEVLGNCGKEDELSSTEVLTLLWLRRESSTVSELAAVVGMQANGMSILIDRLSKRKLVVRRRNRQDRRVVGVDLTTTGEEFAVRIGDQVEATINHLLANLSSSERAEFASVLSRIALPQR